MQDEPAGQAFTSRLRSLFRGKKVIPPSADTCTGYCSGRKPLGRSSIILRIVLPYSFTYVSTSVPFATLVNPPALRYKIDERFQPDPAISMETPSSFVSYTSALSVPISFADMSPGRSTTYTTSGSRRTGPSVSVLA